MSFYYGGFTSKKNTGGGNICLKVIHSQVICNFMYSENTHLNYKFYPTITRSNNTTIVKGVINNQTVTYTLDCFDLNNIPSGKAINGIYSIVSDNNLKDYGDVIIVRAD